MTKMIQVLVVDDLSEWRNTLAGILLDAGYDAKTAADVEEALGLADQDCFDAAVVDMRLDESDEDNTAGLDLAAELKKRFPAMAIVIFTGYGTPDTMRRARKPGPTGSPLADDYIPKTQTEDLVARMNMLLGSSEPGQPRHRRTPRRWRVAMSKLPGSSEIQVPTFKPSQECELSISLEPGQRLLVRGRGSIRFTYTSTNPLNLEPARFVRWGSKRLMSTIDRRFLIKEVGQELYCLLFEQHSAVLNGYHRALGRVTDNRYLHLVLESTRDLAGLPLEFLFSKEAGDYITLLHPLTRQIRGVVTRRDPISAELVRRLVGSGERLRILLLISNTEPRIDLIDEMGEQLAGLLSPVDWLDLTYVRTEAATYSAVQEKLRGCRRHIVHYIGHGDFHEGSPEKSSLFFWKGSNRSGCVAPMSGNELRWLLESSDTRLFHLTCCEGTRTGGSVDLLDNDYLGIADGIVQSGVPSVLGYRWRVPVVGAKEMALAFYRSLLQHGSPELALLDARRDLAMRNKDDLTWASPILIVQS